MPEMIAISQDVWLAPIIYTETAAIMSPHYLHILTLFSFLCMNSR